MALGLQSPENDGEVFDLGREGHSKRVFAFSASVLMTERTINLPPSRFAVSGFPDNSIGATAGQAMEHCIISCADSPAQLGLPRASYNALSQQFSSQNEIKRPQAFGFPIPISE